MSEEVGKVGVVIADEQVLVIAHADEAVERNVVALRSFGEAIEVDARPSRLDGAGTGAACSAG